MTNNPAPVEQVDREAVQAFHRTMLDRLMTDVKSQRPKLGDDEGDAGTLVQAFARHRLAERERCAKVAEDCDDLEASSDADLITTAIRSSSDAE